MRSSLLALLLATLALAACESVTSSEPERRLRIGTIEFYDEPVTIETPETVAAGAEFEVLVRTFGGGCVEMGPTRVEPITGGARIVPIDSELFGENVVCTDQLKIFEHRARLSFDEPGTTLIVVRGGSEPSGAVVEFEREIEVTR